MLSIDLQLVLNFTEVQISSARMAEGRING